MSVTSPLVVALGGNALSHPEDPIGLAGQYEQMARTAVHVIDALADGRRMVLTHGNGPQVGVALRRCEVAADQVEPLPLEVCVASTQGTMGFMVTQGLVNEIERRNLKQPVTAVVTTVLVDAADPAFSNPTKPIGRTYSRDEAVPLLEQGWTMKSAGDGKYRRVTASPRPIRILETRGLKDLVEAGHLLVACGGGGIPVVETLDGAYEGVGAVVDKDLASALLATELGAQQFVILTAVDRVCLRFGQTDQVELETMTVSEAHTYLQNGEFPAGSMGPKIQAAAEFLEAGAQDAEVIITSPELMTDALAGNAGTRITL
jgi:carbamate kinase